MVFTHLSTKARENILNDISYYYSEKIVKHGTSPRGVDWKDESSQILRFEKLCKVIINDDFVVADLGCGFGKMYEYIHKKFRKFYYVGYDLSRNMIDQAKKFINDLNLGVNNFKLQQIDDLKELEYADYYIASGIFNVKMNYAEAEWLPYILDTLKKMNKLSKKGFSFNMLTKYSDKEYMRSDLYYADPLFIFDFCMRNFSRKVALLHDYGLYEFTIIVRK